ncbi:MAG TPA: hypothetical protein VF202_04015 [Trueperaceae bacterium]
MRPRRGRTTRVLASWSGRTSLRGARVRGARARGALLGALALLLGTPGTALATTYVALTPYEVLDLADAVLTARVADVTTRADDAGVWTVVTLEVREWLTDDPEAGEDEAPREEVVIEVLGGEAEGRRLIVPGSPAWRPGDEVLVALHAAAGLASPVVGFAQGLWREDGAGLVDAQGRFLGLDPAGALVRAEGPTAVESVLEVVRRALAGEAPPPADAAPPAGEPGGDGPDAPPGEEGGRPAPPGEEGGAEPAPPGEEGGAEPAPPEEEVGEASEAEPAPPAPAARVEAAYAVDDAGGPLLLSDRLAAAAAAWEELAPDTVEVSRSPDADHAFAYGDPALFGPAVLTLTLAEGREVRVLVRPEEHELLAAALRHEVGALLGLPPTPSGVMAMALTDPAALPGEAELAELAALTSFDPADLDRDGVVGFGDLLELAAAYGQAGVNVRGDLDGDGDVDDDDVAVLRRSYRFTAPAGAPSPDEEGGGAREGAGPEPQGEPEPEQPGGPEGPDQPEGPDEPDEPDGPDEPGEPGDDPGGAP